MPVELRTLFRRIAGVRLQIFLSQFRWLGLHFTEGQRQPTLSTKVQGMRARFRSHRMCSLSSCDVALIRFQCDILVGGRTIGPKQGWITRILQKTKPVESPIRMTNDERKFKIRKPNAEIRRNCDRE